MNEERVNELIEYHKALTFAIQSRMSRISIVSNPEGMDDHATITSAIEHIRLNLSAAEGLAKRLVKVEKELKELTESGNGLQVL